MFRSSVLWPEILMPVQHCCRRRSTLKDLMALLRTFQLCVGRMGICNAPAQRNERIMHWKWLCNWIYKVPCWGPEWHCSPPRAWQIGFLCHAVVSPSQAENGNNNVQMLGASLSKVANNLVSHAWMSQLVAEVNRKMHVNDCLVSSCCRLRDSLTSNAMELWPMSLVMSAPQKQFAVSLWTSPHNTFAELKDCNSDNSCIGNWICNHELNATACVFRNLLEAPALWLCGMHQLHKAQIRVRCSCFLQKEVILSWSAWDDKAVTVTHHSNCLHLKLWGCSMLHTCSSQTACLVALCEKKRRNMECHLLREFFVAMTQWPCRHFLMRWTRRTNPSAVILDWQKVVSETNSGMQGHVLHQCGLISHSDIAMCVAPCLHWTGLNAINDVHIQVQSELQQCILIVEVNDCLACFLPIGKLVIRCTIFVMASNCMLLSSSWCGVCVTSFMVCWKNPF